jgi:protein-L-isoaspartate(D-aspartate) O-methyltransferase
MTLADTPALRSRRAQLVTTLRNKGIRDERVLHAIASIPRHYFIESALAEQAYEDQALPILEGQTISQPYTVAFQTELLNVQPDDKILEIGTGSGYQCAILCALGAEVYSIERNERLYHYTQALLDDLGYHPHLFLGDGTLGLPDIAPFDGILVTAGSPNVPPTLLEQLTIGGRMVIPVGDRESQIMQKITRVSLKDYELTEHDRFRFVPLIGNQGWAKE